MTDRLLAVWRWIGGHRLAAGWAAAALSAAALGGGVAMGAATQAPPPVVEEQPVTMAARPRPLRVEAEVVGRRGANLLARTRDGDLLLVRITAETAFRRRNAAVDPSEIRRGTRVLLVGRSPRPGVFRARTVIIRPPPREVPPPLPQTGWEP